MPRRRRSSGSTGISRQVTRREEALAICFANLKGTRDKDLILTAKALEYLKTNPGRRSNAEVGKEVGVSGEIVREFLALLRLPEPVQELIDQGRLTLDQGRRLWQLSRNRRDIVEEVATAMTSLTATDARHLIDYLLRYPDTSVDDAKRRVLESKTVVEREYHVVALLSEQEYRALERKARRNRLGPSELVTEIVTQWLKSISDIGDEQ